VIVVTNPLDVMTYVALKKTGFKKEKLFGMSGVLDSSRLRYFIAKELGVSVKGVSAMVLGSHGDHMLPLMRYTTVAGIQVTELISQTKLDKIAERTKKAGGEIVSYLKTGSAYHAPAAAITEMVESIAKDQNQVMPACVYLDGEYGLKNVTVGVPSVLGMNGIEKIIELKLTKEELSSLHASAKDTQESIKHLKLG